MTYAYFTDLNFDQPIFDAQINKMQAMYKNILSNPNAFFSKELNDYFNEKNPRYNGAYPTEQSLKNTDYTLSYKKYKERFANAADFEFFFVGNIDDQKLEEFCSKYLASLPANTIREKEVDLGYRMKITETKKIVNKGKEPKSMVMILFHDELKFNKKEANSLSLLGEVLKIKLTEKLREIESGVYGISSYGAISKKPAGNYTFNITFPCGPENVDKLTASALNELQKIITQGPEEKDLNKVIDARILELKNSKKENSYWLSKLSSTYSSKESIESLLKESDDFKNIKIKDLQNVAQKYLTKEKFIGVLMPESN
jgi:zinc protease